MLFSSDTMPTIEETTRQNICLMNEQLTNLKSTICSSLQQLNSSESNQTSNYQSDLLIILNELETITENLRNISGRKVCFYDKDFNELLLEEYFQTLTTFCQSLQKSIEDNDLMMLAAERQQSRFGSFTQRKRRNVDDNADGELQKAICRLQSTNRFRQRRQCYSISTDAHITNDPSFPKSNSQPSLSGLSVARKLLYVPQIYSNPGALIEEDEEEKKPNRRPPCKSKSMYTFDCDLQPPSIESLRNFHSSVIIQNPHVKGATPADQIETRRQEDRSITAPIEEIEEWDEEDDESSSSSSSSAYSSDCEMFTLDTSQINSPYSCLDAIHI